MSKPHSLFPNSLLVLHDDWSIAAYAYVQGLVSQSCISCCCNVYTTGQPVEKGGDYDGSGHEYKGLLKCTVWNVVFYQLESSIS